MNAPGENDSWTATRLAARLAALRGLAPAPACYLVWRATGQDGVAGEAGYELPNTPGRTDEAGFERWLQDRGLAGGDRLAVSVLVIREELDGNGMVRECVLERRRGGADGPLYGKVARVEFSGAARRVRRYQASADGRLTELPAEPGPDVAPADETPDAEGFAGEDAAVHAWLGPGAVILDRRAPTLFEDLAGFSAIVHARRWDGDVLGCAVGWHGTAAYVVPGDFPRRSGALVAPPDLHAAAAEAAIAHDLTLHETRLDEKGFCVMARSRAGRTLVAIRLDDGATRIDPYVPGRVADALEDQRRWMAYAEKYEGRTVLDSWREGDGGDIAVVTVDRDREAWCHIVDPDGIERSRRAGNDTAAAAQYRERGAPEADPPVIPDPAPPAPDTANAVAVAANPAAGESAAADYPVAADSLLTQVRAYALVTARLRAAAEACGAGLRDDPAVPRAAVEPLTGLREPLLQLHARFSAGSVQQLIQRAEAGTLTRHAFAVALEDLVTRLRDELALTRIVLMPSGARPEPGEAPFGGRVETRFPEAAYDIEEAVHCLALRRATAAVLHAMQVMRHGLRAASGLLDTPPLTALSWSALIETVRAAGADREMVEALHRVRRLLHRPDLTPGGKYTEAEAEAVLEAVASFMRCLAGAMDARGVPVGD